jgi:peptidoglycan/LPS O-acetylase OafA/YrhL
VGLDETVLELGVALLLIAMQQRFDATAAAGRAAAARTFLGTMVGAPGAVVRWFGRNSYEVYLTHMLVVWPMVGLFAITHQGINMAPVWFVATIALAGALGHVVSRYYSEPLNRKLRRGLISRGTRDVAVPAVARELA